MCVCIFVYCSELRFTDLIKTESFQSLPPSFICEYLADEDIVITSEDEVLEAAISWLAANIKNCDRTLVDSVLRCVRFEHCSVECLYDMLLNNEFVRSSAALFYSPLMLACLYKTAMKTDSSEKTPWRTDRSKETKVQQQTHQL